MQQNKFSWKERSNSFTYAANGLKALFKTEHNARIHVAITVLVFGIAFILKVTYTELLIIILSTGFVFVAEIFNTAIEKTMDFISIEKHPQIKLVKDLSAAAVLIAAATAVIAGCIIFIPKIL